jgi:hypothetical protein
MYSKPFTRQSSSSSLCRWRFPICKKIKNKFLSQKKDNIQNTSLNCVISASFMTLTFSFVFVLFSVKTSQGFHPVYWFSMRVAAQHEEGDRWP